MNTKEVKKVCSTCKWYQFNVFFGKYSCVNYSSTYYEKHMNHDSTCGNWESK
jgi:hypothetical protein